MNQLLDRMPKRIQQRINNLSGFAVLEATMAWARDQQLDWFVQTTGDSLSSQDIMDCWLICDGFFGQWVDSDIETVLAWRCRNAKQRYLKVFLRNRLRLDSAPLILEMGLEHLLKGTP